MLTKQCSKCGRELPIEKFSRRTQSKDGHANICKECKSIQDKEYREKNKDAIKSKRKQYREENRDTINAKKKEYYQENREKILEQQATYRQTHKEEKAVADKRYAQQNKEKIQQYQQEYRESHKLSNAEYQKQYREQNKERLTEYKKNLHNRYLTYQRNAKKRNLDFELTEEEFGQISSQPCVYCGEYSDTYNGEWFNGVDRVDSNIGYTKSNSVPCCSICNKMKMDFDVHAWINHMIKITNYYKSTSIEHN